MCSLSCLYTGGSIIRKVQYTHINLLVICGLYEQVFFKNRPVVYMGILVTLFLS